MEIQDFNKKMNDILTEINIKLDDVKIQKFYEYMNLLIEWNNNINLTAITDPNEIILKHFIDSVTIDKHIETNKKVLDIGTGAGFPGIPEKILRDDIDVTLADSLNKRIIFLQEVIKKIDLKNIEAIHGRAEELAHNKKYRESYDIVVSRAVAPLNVLLEYMIPFLKKDGICICMKGSNIDEEIVNSEKALKELGSKIEKIDKFILPASDIIRNIIIIRKEKETLNKYPRKAGTPTKSPII